MLFNRPLIRSPYMFRSVHSTATRAPPTRACVTVRTQPTTLISNCRGASHDQMAREWTISTVPLRCDVHCPNRPLGFGWHLILLYKCACACARARVPQLTCDISHANTRAHRRCARFVEAPRLAHGHKTSAPGARPAVRIACDRRARKNESFMPPQHPNRKEPRTRLAKHASLNMFPISGIWRTNRNHITNALSRAGLQRTPATDDTLGSGGGFIPLRMRHSVRDAKRQMPFVRARMHTHTR